MPCETAGGGGGGGRALRAFAPGGRPDRMRWAVMRLVPVIAPISGPSIIAYLVSSGLKYPGASIGRESPADRTTVSLGKTVIAVDCRAAPMRHHDGRARAPPPWT